MLFHFVYMWQTLPTFWLPKVFLFIQLWRKWIILSLYYYLINIVNIAILSLNLFSKQLFVGESKSVLFKSVLTNKL